MLDYRQFCALIRILVNVTRNRSTLMIESDFNSLRMVTELLRAPLSRARGRKGAVNGRKSLL